MGIKERECVICPFLALVSRGKRDNVNSQSGKGDPDPTWWSTLTYPLLTARTPSDHAVCCYGDRGFSGFPNTHTHLHVVVIIKFHGCGGLD